MPPTVQKQELPVKMLVMMIVMTIDTWREGDDDDDDYDDDDGDDNDDSDDSDDYCNLKARSAIHWKRVVEGTAGFSPIRCRPTWWYV